MQSLSTNILDDVLLTLEDLLESIEHLRAWNKNVLDFVELDSTEEGMKTLAADAMILEALGEGVKVIDKKTEGRLLPLCTEDIAWRDVIGMRNVIAHGYFDIDVNILGRTITSDIPVLERALKELKDIVAAELGRRKDC